MFESPRLNAALNKALQAVVTVYQIVAGLAFVFALILSSRWVKLPFLGAFFEQTMVLTAASPAQPSDAWNLYGQLKVGDQLISVNGVAVRSSNDVREALTGVKVGVIPTTVGFSAGETIPVTIKRGADETEETFDVTLSVFPPEDRLKYIFIPRGISFVFLLISLWIFGMRRGESSGRAFSLFASSLAIIVGTLFDLFTTHTLTYLWTLALGVLGGSMFDMAMTFPQEFGPAIKRPYIRWIGYVIGFALAIRAFTVLFNFQTPMAYIGAWQTLYAFVLLASLTYFGFMIYNWKWSASPVVKLQAGTILFGAVMGFSFILAWLVNNIFGNPFGFGFSTWLFTPLIVFPLAIGYTILRFRILQTDGWIRQGLFYGFFTLIVFGMFALLIAGLTLIFTDIEPLRNPYIATAVALLLVITINPLRNQIQTMVDRSFSRGRRAYLLSQQEFTHKLAVTVSLDGISQALRENIMSTLAPERAHIYIYERLNDQYAAMPGDDGRLTSEIRFAALSPLAQYFQKEKLPLYLDGTNVPAALKVDETRLNLLGARLFIRLPGKERPLGWVALGARLSGQPYSPQDLTFAEALCEQAALSIERAQTVSDLERRVQEMNALARVSQGVNITLDFDDVLELIYAQTAQIIPAANFHITLNNKAANYLYYGFCVENRERIETKENSPLPPNTGLDRDIILRGRPLITQDYPRECQARNLLPAEQNVYAWMGVPLNAGAETIGALSIASRDAIINYTRGQLELLQNIADHTAGAIVKSRLLQETERRARQLSTLNEITRQLTSTLESEPLLNNILENAVSILNCEAGSLFLVDDQTDELIFKVTVGPVASNLLGQRLPAGSGIVGRAVQTRLPVIDNDAQRSGSRHAETDEKTGFHSRSLLAVPLQVKDRVIGVVEVINRRDGLPFGDDDQNLLTAFAGQAAVAIENSRLYTLTDQELAARVEELSVMQRIDRELNASLEMDRAMRITLEWAMRQSGSQAGLIGMLEGADNLKIMAQQGYGQHLSNYAETLLPLDLPVLRQALATGQPQRVTLDPAQGASLLPEAHDQIVIPIRREAQVIGLLMLESATPAGEDISFLSRLSDHAAIAIANAQLFNAVQAANIAKSDFVSFVAHELKNPMTSIKGYSELLAGGKVGAINDMQSNFLGTIRSNVERMSTLVSDLNDNSKIEAGRLRLDFIAMSVAEVVDEVIRSTRRQIDDKKQTVEVVMPDSLPSVWADRIRVGQVLTNLVSNAHKYTPEEGAMTVGAEATANQWDPEGAARVVHLWVRDTGIGISAEDQQKVFQKFFRSEDQKAREAPGTGLGLNITKSLVEMQGGRIWFESEFRKGTTFHFTIPVAEG
ncbi:MAG: GAF domain-containing protein [Chloroflexi bacterium]|nr:GAF domain-containing protein [Chloroflexota bacterium]